MGKISRKKQLDEQRKQFFSIHGDDRSAKDRANAKAMLDALQKKLEDDALREDGFYFINGKYVDSRRPRLTSGMKTRSFDTHQRSITKTAIVRVDKDQNLLILFTFGLDCVSLWNLNDGKFLSSLDISALHGRSICGAATLFQQFGQDTIVFAYSTHNDPIVHCFNYEKNIITPATTNQKKTTNNYFHGHQQAITSMAFSHSGLFLATSSWDSTCMLWKMTPIAKNSSPFSLILLMTLPVHEEGASCLAFTVDDNFLVTCGECIVKLWDLTDSTRNNQIDDSPLTLGAQLQEWQEAIPFSFSIESSTNLFAFDESMTTLIGNHEWVNYRETDEKISLLAPAQDESERNELIDIKQCIDHIVDEVDPNDDEFEKILKTREKENQVTFSSKNNGLKCENDAHALSPEESARLKAQFRKMADFNFEKLFTPALSLSLELNGDTEFNGDADSIPAKLVTRIPPLSRKNDRLVRTFSKKTKGGTFSSHSSTISGCAVAQELDLVVTVAFDQSIRYWSLEEGVVLDTVFDAHNAPINCCALTSPTTCDLNVYEMLLATGGSDNLVKVWRRNEPKPVECVFSIAGHNDAIRSLTFDPSGVFLVSSSEDTTVIVWRVRPASPDQPEIPIVTKVDRFSIDISWTESLANGAKVLHYIVRTIQVSSFLGDGSDIVVIPDVEVPVKYQFKTIENLQPGVKYTLQVAAVNEIGNSGFSTATEPIETLAFIPSRIERQVQHENQEATRITLSWTAPCPNGAAIVSYTLQCRPENKEFVPLQEVTIPVTDLKVTYVLPTTGPNSRRRSSVLKAPTPAASPPILSYTVDELWAGEVYQFAVAASNRCGLGQFSRVSDYVKMDCTAPDQPEKPEIIRVDKRQLDVQWIKPRCNGSEVLQYTLRWRQELEDCQEPLEKTLSLLTRSIIGTKYTITGLDPGAPVQAWVSASNLVDNKLLTSLESLPSDSKTTLCDVPDTPDVPELLDPSAHTLMVAWKPPKRNGLPIDAYNVALYSEETQFGVHVRQLSREVTLQSQDLVNRSEHPKVAFILRHLRGGTFYSATVSATNSLGTSGVSEACVPVQTDVPIVPEAVPDAPIVSDVTPTSAIVSWELPEHDGGAALRSFHVEYTVRSIGKQDKVESGGDITISHGLELHATFLKPHRIYRFRVSSENRVGRSTPSAWSEEVATPSLVEFTITRYFAHRPTHEHDAARFIQRRYRLWKETAAYEARFTAALLEILRHWHL
ncbi:Titin [Phytophthora citrophthora]|uniref:Titin n=1 Tax=Phytophthora citrophthora TaxID=4793 RepID=A0AAD9LGB1_9STRA|nr:Titin [Phytophthora citrophthora]